MNVFYEEEGSFKAASVMTETPASLQVEALSGKRSKVKAANVLLRFEGALAGFLDAAQAEAETLDTSFRQPSLSGCTVPPSISTARVVAVTRRRPKRR